MKIIVTTIAFVCLTNLAFAQKNVSKKLPPIKELPANGEMKVFHELDAEYDYKIYNSKGSLIEEGHKQFIDITGYEEGEYFIVYNDKKELFKRKED